MFSLTDITLQRGKRVLLENASLTVFAKQKIGVIGANGTGKSSLFAMLLGNLSADKGDINIPAKLRIAHLSQEIPALEISAIEYVKQGDQELCEIEEQMQQAEQQGNIEKISKLHERYYDLDGYTVTARIARLLSGLGFASDEFTKPVKAFSGGWRMRLNLARALNSRSDVLLLDEPTNHLDLDAIIWLEEYLKNYPGTLLLISHDREFLDGIVDRIVHLERQQFFSYGGNYSTFEKTRAAQLAMQQAMYEKQQKKIAHMMSYVDRFRYKASKARQAQSRLKAIDRLETIAAVQTETPFSFEFRPTATCGNPVVHLEKVDVGYGDHLILKNINLSVTPGARIGLLGPNGAGKSTFIKFLARTLPAKKGIYTAASGLKIGYYAQHQLESLHLDESPLQHLKRLDPQASEQSLRTFLGSFDFYGDTALHPITHFSGGEKARLALALLIWQAPNLLLLDEPTNHLDIEMRNALILALQSYTGAMFIISHDRYLLNATVDEFLLIANQQVVSYTGDIADYQNQVNQIQAAKESGKSEKNSDKVTQREQSKDKSKIEKKINKIEEEMNQLQAEIQVNENKLADAELYTDKNKALLDQLLHQQQKLQLALQALEKQWLELQV